MSTNLIHQRDVLCEAVTILAGVDSVADAVRMAALQKLNADWQTNLSYAHTDDEVDRRALKREDIGVCAVEDCIYRSHGLNLEHDLR